MEDYSQLGMRGCAGCNSHFHGVRHEEGGKGNVVETVVDENDTRDGVTSLTVGRDDLACLVKHLRIGVDGAASSPDSVGNAHSSGGSEEEYSTTGSLDDQRTHVGSTQVVDLSSALNDPLSGNNIPGGYRCTSSSRIQL